MPNINPQILTWARDTAGLSIQEAVKKLGIGDARGVAAPVRLAELENGEKAPTQALLLKMSKVYRRPLLAFYMNAPPRKGDRGEDFRSGPDRETTAEPLVDALVRDVKARQAMVRAILEDDEDAEPVAFVGSMAMRDGLGKVLASIRQTLALDLGEYRAQGSADAAFALLRSKVESAGVFVLLLGNLGSHHTAIDATVFRGFALADPLAPFIVVNDQDAKTAWSFTLLHELAHLWLGSTGVSGIFGESRLEQFCNDVASDFLLPGAEVKELAASLPIAFSDGDALARSISDFADGRLISRSMVAYRLYRANSISHDTWTSLAARFRGEWSRARVAQRERNRDREGGPNYYVVRRHRVGSALLRLIARTLNEGSVTPTKAGKILGVKPRSVGPLLSNLPLTATPPRLAS